MPVNRAHEMLKAAAKRAVANAGGMKPLVWQGPLLAEFVMNGAALADQMAVLPPARRTDPMTVAFDCKTMAEVIGWMNALSAMSFALR